MGKGKGYLLPPADYSYEDYACVSVMVPNLPEARTAVLGQIFALTHWYMWERTGDDRARVWSEDIAQAIIPSIAVSVGECGGMNCDEIQECLTEALSYGGVLYPALMSLLDQQQARKLAAERTKNLAPGARYAKLEGYSTDDNRIALCEACRLILEAVIDTENARRDNAQDLILAATQTLSVGLLIAAGLGAGPAGLAVGTIITQGINAGAIQLAEMSTETLNNETYRFDCQCAMYHALVGAEISPEVFASSLDAVESPSDQLAGAIAYILAETDVYTAFTAYLEDVTADVSQGATVSCECALTLSCIPCVYGSNYYVSAANHYAGATQYQNQTHWVTEHNPRTVSVQLTKNAEVFLEEFDIVLDQPTCVKSVQIEFFGNSSWTTRQFEVWINGVDYGDTTYFSINDINWLTGNCTLPSPVSADTIHIIPKGGATGIYRIQIFACVEGL